MQELERDEPPQLHFEDGGRDGEVSPRLKQLDLRDGTVALPDDLVKHRIEDEHGDVDRDQPGGNRPHPHPAERRARSRGGAVVVAVVNAHRTSVGGRISNDQ
jgi:hypothetical protein